MAEGSGTFIYEPGMLTVEPQYVVEVLQRQYYRHILLHAGINFCQNDCGVKLPAHFLLLSRLRMRKSFSTLASVYHCDVVFKLCRQVTLSVTLL
jgi:hypothetical protein